MGGKGRSRAEVLGVVVGRWDMSGPGCCILALSACLEAWCPESPGDRHSVLTPAQLAAALTIQQILEPEEALKRQLGVKLSIKNL